MLRMTRAHRARDRRAQPVPGGRRRAQLRRQRQDAARRPVRRHLDPAGGGRRRRLGRRGAVRLPPVQGTSRAASTASSTACAAPTSARPTGNARSSSGCAPPARASRVVDDAAVIDGGGRRARGAKGAGLVPGPHGVRPARARRALDPRRSALAVMQKTAQPEGQVPRVVPAVRAGGAARGRRRLVRTRLRFAVHAAGRRRAARAPARDDRRRSRSCSASTSSTCRARTFPAVTHVDYSARVQTVHRETNPALPCAARGVQAAHRLPGAGQHQLQRARRADRLHARGCLPLLHGQRDRNAGDRQLRAAQGTAEPRAQARLQACFRTRLSPPAHASRPRGPGPVRRQDRRLKPRAANATIALFARGRERQRDGRISSGPFFLRAWFHGLAAAGDSCRNELAGHRRTNRDFAGL